MPSTAYWIGEARSPSISPDPRQGYAKQISRWRTEKPSKNQARELDRMEAQNRQLRAATADVLALASELRKGAIERVIGMSDIELGLQALLGSQAPSRR